MTLSIRVRGMWRIRLVRVVATLLGQSTPPGLVQWAIDRMEWSIEGGPWRPIVEDLDR
jgi:hypothetical protein